MLFVALQGVAPGVGALLTLIFPGRDFCLELPRLFPPGANSLPEMSARFALLFTLVEQFS